eukprot:3019636-Rhodomonas_salina.2
MLQLPRHRAGCSLGVTSQHFQQSRDERVTLHHQKLVSCVWPVQHHCGRGQNRMEALVKECVSAVGCDSGIYAPYVLAILQVPNPHSTPSPLRVSSEFPYKHAVLQTLSFLKQSRPRTARPPVCCGLSVDAECFAGQYGGRQGICHL